MGKKKKPICVNLLKPVSCAIACTPSGYREAQYSSGAIRRIWLLHGLGNKQRKLWMSARCPALGHSAGVAEGHGCLQAPCEPPHHKDRVHLWPHQTTALGCTSFLKGSKGHCKVNLASLCCVVVPHNGENL